MLLPTKGQGTPSSYPYHCVSLITCNQWLVPKNPLKSYFENKLRKANYECPS